MEEAKKAKSEKAEAGGQSFFKGVRKEFSRITWPTRSDIVKQTAAVVVISVLAGLMITVLDLVFSRLIYMLAGI